MADKRKMSRKPQGGTANEPGGVEESKGGAVKLGEEVQMAIRTAVTAAVQEATREQHEMNTRLEQALLEQREQQREINTRFERTLFEQREMMAKLVDMSV